MVFISFKIQPPDCLRSDGEVGVSTKRALAFRCRTLDRLLSWGSTENWNWHSELNSQATHWSRHLHKVSSPKCSQFLNLALHLQSAEVAPDFQLEI